MKKLLFILLIIPLVSFGQDYYVSAKSGLNLREAPNATAKKVAKLLYGQKVSIESKTGIELIIKDNNEKIVCEWVEVGAVILKDYGMEGYVTEQIRGFVFNGFLKKLDFPKYINEDYVDTSILNGDCIKYKSGVPFSGVAYQIHYGFTFKHKYSSLNRDYGNFMEGLNKTISPIIIKISRFKNGVIEGEQKVIDPLNDLKREVIILPELKSNNDGIIVMKYSDFEIVQGDLEMYVYPSEVNFFEFSGQPLSSGVSFESIDENNTRLFQLNFKNKYLKIEYSETYAREEGEYSHFENDFNREYSNYINSNCSLNRKVTNVEIIENFSVIE